MQSHSYHLFVFHGSGHHPHLHSFPTRRSSDLPAFAARSFNCARTDRTWASASKLSFIPSTEPLCISNCLRRSARDRKSTRLNSSHRCISYAVFCLKKKNHKNQKHQLSIKPHIN